METIIVGIDDSANARLALRWALDHAHDGDEVVAVHVWHMPPVGGFETTFLDPAVFDQVVNERLFGESVGIIAAMLGLAFLQYWQNRRQAVS